MEPPVVYTVSAGFLILSLIRSWLSPGGPLRGKDGALFAAAMPRRTRNVPDTSRPGIRHVLDAPRP